MLWAERVDINRKGKARSYLRSKLGESNSGVQLDHLCGDEQTLLTNEPEIVQAFTELQGALQHSF